ncbi:D-amino acid dehydrogenase [Salinisphaera aquimarina]|uniref:D-amino acid dehydrogenase n=1 Tax=Salinisphaera aquimarina TaxID=2094031 RepID=A0ABV7ESB0_9GAMM
MKHIAVIGGGISGVTTAYALTRRGFDVTLFDRNRYAAMETSFANGGQLSASNAEVWNNWGMVAKGLKWMFRRDAPLLVNPKPSWHKLSWFFEFMRAIPRYEQNTTDTARLAIEARQYLFSWAEEENIDFDLKQKGILHIYRDKASFQHAEKVTAMLAAGGLERRAVTVGEMRQIEPTLAGDYYGGFFTESDSTGDIHKYSNGLARAAEKRGAKLRYEHDVQKLTVDENGVTVTSSAPEGDTEHRFDAMVMCAGTASRTMAAQVGDRVNVYPVKGYSITVNLDDEASQAAAPQVSLLDDATKLVSSRLGQRLRVAGSAEFNGFNRDIRADRIEPLTEWVQQLFPGVSTRSVVPWAGLRPMLPDMMPRVGPGNSPRVFYNTGHGHLGWTLSAGTADAIATIIQDRVGTA